MDQEPTDAITPDESAGAEAMTKQTPLNRKANGPLSGGLGIFVFVVLFGAAGYLTYKTLFTAEPPTPEPIVVKFMCRDTGKVFDYAMDVGETIPVPSPYTNKRTGLPVEECYWTRGDKRKLEPTYVILNSTLGKEGDTICPDCGRIVVGHNPRPPEDVPLATSRPAVSTVGAKKPETKAAGN